jgi:hypothetical protein
MDLIIACLRHQDTSAAPLLLLCRQRRGMKAVRPVRDQLGRLVKRTTSGLIPRSGEVSAPGGQDHRYRLNRLSWRWHSGTLCTGAWPSSSSRVWNSLKPNTDCLAPRKESKKQGNCLHFPRDLAQAARRGAARKRNGSIAPTSFASRPSHWSNRGHQDASGRKAGGLPAPRPAGAAGLEPRRGRGPGAGRAGQRLRWRSCAAPGWCRRVRLSRVQRVMAC